MEEKLFLCYPAYTEGDMGVAALIMAAVGAVIIFAIKGTEKISWMPWLNVHAFGWILLLIGGLYAAVAATPHYYRWRGRD